MRHAYIATVFPPQWAARIFSGTPMFTDLALMLALVLSHSQAFLTPARFPDSASLCATRRHSVVAMLLAPKGKDNLDLRSVQDGKDDFQKYWGTGFSGGWGDDTAPLPMSTQAFVNEMITTVTIALASPNYREPASALTP